jgi:hypothetical protein
MWNPYSLRPPVLGGNVVTRQIFIHLPFYGGNGVGFDVGNESDVAV